MIYQDVYSQLARPMDMFGAVQEVKQAQALEQQNQIALERQRMAAEQQKIADDLSRGKYVYTTLSAFKRLPPQSRVASWNTTRQKLETLVPEMKGVLPSVWDDNDPENQSSLDEVLGAYEQFVPAETFTLGEGQQRFEQRPGQAPRLVASGTPKAGGGVKMVEVKAGDYTMRIPEGTLPSGSILSGGFVYDISNRLKAVPVDEYFSRNPGDYFQTPEGSAAPAPIVTPSVPATRSSTNRAGETNVGYPIDMSMAAPSGVNSLVAMNIPADAEAPGVAPPMGGNALFGGMGMALPVSPEMFAENMNMLAQEQGQFAPLRPAGSAPNRFGSPGVEGIEQAYTGGMEQPRIINGMVAYPVPRKPGEAKETYRDMTPEEIRASGRDPARFSGQVSSLGQKKFEALPSAAASEIEQAQLDKLRAEAEISKRKAEEEKRQARKNQQDAVSLLRGIKRIESALGSLQGSAFFDTGVIDQYFMAKTDKGKELAKANQAILATVKRLTRTPGEGAFSNLDVGLLEGQLPDIGSPMSSNIESLQQIKADALAAYGVQAAVSNKAERDALPPGTIYVDINTGIKYQKGEK